MKSGWTVRLGEACVLSLGVATFTAIPTALRTAGAGASFISGLFVGTAVLVLPLALTLLLARAAGRGFRGIVGTTPRRVILFGIALWIGLALPALTLAARVIKAYTHHRGLGAAAFAFAGIVTVVLAAAAAHRMVAVGQALVERGVRPWIPAAAGAAIGVVPLLVMAAPLAGRGGGAGGIEVRAAIIDGAIALVATALVSSVQLGARLTKLAGTWGVPLAAIVAIGGTARVEAAPELGSALRAGGGLPATLLGALESWTDRDGDGRGAHFGGGDCDEGDRARHPGGIDVPGDGVDQDCDGRDAPLPASEGPSRVHADSPKAERAADGDGAGPNVPAAAIVPPPAVPARPDILLVTLDTVRADHTTVYGYDKDTTPNLAKLAAGGVVFEHAYATASDTQRALAPLVSGRRLSRTSHDTREWPTLLSDIDTVAERLKRAGYATAAVTSFTWLSEERGFAQGFERFEPVFSKVHPERGATGELATAAAKAVLRDLGRGDRPVFLWVHYFDAHERYLPHRGIDFGKDAAALYDGEIAFVDRQLGELMDAAHPSRHIAWLVHGSNGEAFDEHGARGHGTELYDEAIRVPLVLAVSDEKPGRYGPSAVSVADIPATIADLAGAAREGVDGVSLAPLARGEAAVDRLPVMAHAHRRAAVIAWPLKLLVVSRKRSDKKLLFDLAADPGETRDLADERPEDVARLEATLRDP
jgi:arylsulfatase A-like enzyme